MLPLIDVRDLDDSGNLKMGAARLHAIAMGYLTPDARISPIDNCVGIVETYGDENEETREDFDCE